MLEPLRTLAPIVAVFAIIIGAMMWAFDGLLERRSNPNLNIVTGAGASQRVVLKRNPFGQYRSPGTINNREVSFLVDTGADQVAVPGGIAASLGLERGRPVQIITAGGPSVAYRTTLDQISLGGIRLKNVQGSIVPAMSDDQVLLGMTFLRHVDFQKKGDELVIEPGSLR